MRASLIPEHIWRQRFCWLYQVVPSRHQTWKIRIPSNMIPRKSKNLHFRLGSWFLVNGGLQKEFYSALDTSRWKWFCHWRWTLTTSIQWAFAYSWRTQWHAQEYRFHCISKKCPSTPMDSSTSSSHCCQGLLVYGSMHVVEYCYCWLGAGTQKQLLSKSDPIYFGAMLAKTTGSLG